MRRHSLEAILPEGWIDRDLAVGTCFTPETPFHPVKVDIVFGLGLLDDLIKLDDVPQEELVLVTLVDMIYMYWIAEYMDPVCSALALGKPRLDLLITAPEQSGADVLETG